MSSGDLQGGVGVGWHGEGGVRGGPSRKRLVAFGTPVWVKELALLWCGEAVFVVS